MDTSLFVYIVFAYVYSVCGQSFNPAPRNSAGVVGSNVTLYCGYTGSVGRVTWIKKDLTGSDDRTLSDSSNGNSNIFLPEEYDVKYTSTTSGARYDLVIINVEIGVDPDSGLFECHLVATPTGDIRARAYVTILESDPECESVPDDFGDVKENELISIQCAQSYSGLWAPIQDWSDNFGAIVTPSNYSIEDRLNFYYLVDPITRGYNGISYIVSTRFPQPPDNTIPDDSATIFYARNAPTYSPTDFQTATLVVQYPVENLVISPSSGNANPGDSITCTAQGIPTPQVEWLDMDNFNNSISSGSNVLIVTVEMEGIQNYACDARNTIRGDTTILYQPLVLNVTVPPTTTTTTTTAASTTLGNGNDGYGGEGSSTNNGSGLNDGEIAAIVICIILFLIILAVALFCCCYRKAPEKEKTRPPPSTVASIPTDHIRPGAKPSDNLSYVSEKSPPYNPYNPYASLPRPEYDNGNPNMMYADLALDDTPRSRKPIQVYDNYEPSEFGDIRRV